MPDPDQPELDLPQRVAHYFEQGAVTLLFDARHGGNSGLPARMDSHIVRVDLADADDFCEIGKTHLRVTFLDQAVATEAWLAWDAAFYLRGRAAADRMEAHLVPARVPACFEPHRIANVERALNQMGLGRGQPSGVEWNFSVNPAMLAEDADRSGWCAVKQLAVQQAVQGQAGRAVLLIDTSAGDVRAPAGFIQGAHAEWQVGVAPPWAGMAYGAHALVWREQQGSNTLEFVIPWSRIGAVQDPANGRGWFWPGDLPDAARGALQNLQDIWPVLQRQVGVPLAPPPPPPREHLRVAGLSPPRPDSKHRALYRLLRLGTTVVLVDTRVPGCRLPPTLPGRVWLLMVPLNLPNLDPQARLDDDGLMAVIPDHDGKIAPIAVPWRAMFLMAAAGGLSVNVWEEDYPDEVVQALHVLSAAQSRKDVAPDSYTIFDRDPNGDGLGMSLEADAQGQFALHVSQPVSKLQAPPGSPPGTQARALLELAFSLPPPTSH